MTSALVFLEGSASPQPLVNDLEAIGDIIDKNIMPLARKMINSDCCFLEQGISEITEFHKMIEENMNYAVQALNNNDIILAKKIAESKSIIGRRESELRMHHIERLHQGLSDSMDTSSIHFDLTDQYKRINSHIVSIGYILQGKL